LAEVVERLSAPAPKVARLLEESEPDVLAFFSFPREHWSKLRSTNPLERVNREIGRRSDVIGILPNDAALLRLAGSLLVEQNDEWLVGRRYLSAEAMTERRCLRSRGLEQPSPLPTISSYTTKRYLTVGIAREPTDLAAKCETIAFVDAPRSVRRGQRVALRVRPDSPYGGEPAARWCRGRYRATVFAVRFVCPPNAVTNCREPERATTVGRVRFRIR